MVEDTLQETPWQQALLDANRANPYPFYAELRKTPVSRQPDGSYVVSTYREIVALLHDPRVSSDPRKEAGPEVAEADQGGFVSLDPPKHDRVRGQATWPYGPPHTPGRVAGMEPGIGRLVNRQIDALRGEMRIDIVEDFAYPIPVTVIYELLGVPREDEPRFKVWAEAAAAGRDPEAQSAQDGRGRDQAAQAIAALRQYIAALVERHRQQPGPSLLSGIVTDHGPERFDPDREDNQHLGFGSGVHHCFGAPLARLEAQIALTELARRLENPRPAPCPR